MFKADLDNFIGPKDVHKIAYTKKTDISGFTEDLVFQYYPAYKLFKNGVEVTGDILNKVIQYTVGLRQPDNYIGIQIGQYVDNTWPPQHEGHIFVADNKQNVININEEVLQADYIIVNDIAYLVNQQELINPYNWIQLGQSPVTMGPWWNDPTIGVDINGVSEIGQALDFHDVNLTNNDYSYRLLNSGNMLYFSGDATMTDVFINKLTVNDTITTSSLIADNATITTLTIDTGNIDTLVSNIATIESLTNTDASITNASITNASIDNLSVNSTTADTITVDTATINNLTNTNLTSDTATINDLTNTNLTSDTANITNITSDTITANTLTGDLAANNISGVIDISNLPIQDIINAVNAFNAV